MNFIVAYETTDMFKFLEVAQYFQDNNLEFQKLHEFRLYPETNYYSGGLPAFIRVKETDANKAYRLLLKGKYLDNIPNEFHNIFNDKSKLNNDLFTQETQTLIGSKIISVKYIVANEYRIEFEYINSVDYGIIIQFDNHKCLTWKFEESDLEIENGITIPDRYEVKLSDSKGKIDSDFKTVDVSENLLWGSVIGKAVNSIKTYGQIFKGYNLLTDLIIELNEGQVSIISTAEPSEKDIEEKAVFPINNEWTIVMFSSNKSQSEHVMETSSSRLDSSNPK